MVARISVITTTSDVPFFALGGAGGPFRLIGRNRLDQPFPVIDVCSKTSHCL